MKHMNYQLGTELRELNITIGSSFNMLKSIRSDVWRAEKERNKSCYLKVKTAEVSLGVQR